MKIAYQDLINKLSENPSKELLSEKLFQLGHEHEINNDIFDMELTPNRGDCLSVIGLSRDLAIFFGKSETLDLYQDDIELLDINFKNLSPNLLDKSGRVKNKAKTAKTSIKINEEIINNFGFQTMLAKIPPHALTRKLVLSPVNADTPIDSNPIIPEKIPALLFLLTAIAIKIQNKGSETLAR